MKSIEKFYFILTVLLSQRGGEEAYNTINIEVFPNLSLQPSLQYYLPDYLFSSSTKGSIV